MVFHDSNFTCDFVDRKNKSWPAELWPGPNGFVMARVRDSPNSEVIQQTECPNLDYENYQAAARNTKRKNDDVIVAEAVQKKPAILKKPEKIDVSKPHLQLGIPQGNAKGQDRSTSKEGWRCCGAIGCCVRCLRRNSAAAHSN